jgi:hypothetical protein
MGVAGRKNPRLAPWATVLRRYRGLCVVRQNYGPQAGEVVALRVAAGFRFVI